MQNNFVIFIINQNNLKKLKTFLFLYLEFKNETFYSLYANFYFSY